MSAVVTVPELSDPPTPLGAPWERPLRGTLDALVIDSAVLRDNPLGDPSRRPLWVYTPPGAEERTLPSIYLIQGMTGQVDMWRNRKAFRPTVVELVDDLFAGDCPPARVVFVDCWTSYGGSQFLDSPGTGRYHTYLCDEVVPAVDARYPTEGGAARRAITGKSSGGYGAMVTPMLRPDLFGALATHAGDALFEACYLPEFAACARILRDAYDGSFDRFWQDFRSRPAMTRRGDDVLVNEYAMAACYSANDDGSVDLPFDTATGRLVDAVWERWLGWDPVRMAPRYADALRSLRTVYVDAGRRDEYHLDVGAGAFRAECERAGVRDLRFELFDAGHGDIEYRYPIALEHLARALSEGTS